MKTKKEIDTILNSKPNNFNVKDLKSFSRSYRMLGKMFTHNLPMYSRKKPKVALYAELFGDDINHNPWKTDEGLALAKLLYGEIRQPHMFKLWENIEHIPYQRKEFSLPFRTNPSVINLENKLSIFTSILSPFFDFNTTSLQEQAQLFGHLNFDFVSGYFFGTVLQDDNKELEDTLVNIVKGNDEIAKLTEQHVLALLLSGKQSHWQLLRGHWQQKSGKFSLYHKVLKKAVYAPTAIFADVIEALLEDGLTADERVLTIVGYWFGFEWQQPKKDEVASILKLASSFLIDPKKRKEGLNSESLTAMYVALWALAVEDVGVSNKEVFTLVVDDNVPLSRKIVALAFAATTEIQNAAYSSCLELKWGENTELDYWLLKNLPDMELSDALLKRIKKTADGLPKSGLKVKGSPFSWSDYEIKASFFYNYLVLNATEAQWEFLTMNLAQIPNQESAMLMKRLFPDYYRESMSVIYGYKFFNIHKKVPALILENNDWRRKLLHKAIVHKNETVKATGLQAFYRVTLTTEDFLFLEGLLGTADAALRDLLLDIVLKEDDKKVLEVAENLLGSKAIEQRLTGLELLAAMQKAKRSLSNITQRINTYFETQKITEVDEIVMLDGLLGSNDNESAPYLKMNESDRNKVLALFGRRGVGVFQAALLSLLNQSDSGASEMLNHLLSSNDSEIRLAGLEAASHMVNQDRPKNLVPDALQIYRKRNDMTIVEKALLTKFS